MVGIVAFGAYVPRMRLQRSAVVAANSWFNSALKSHAKGEKAVANWDEDSITMAVEAARDSLNGQDREAIGAVFLASTTLPFADRQNAVIVKEALNLGDHVATLDVGGSRRCGVSALIQAVASAASDGTTRLCVASEKPKDRPASELELTHGDAAAAFVVGAQREIARHLASYTLSADFVDHFRAQGRDYDYEWESRWIRDEGYGKLAPQAVAGVLRRADLRADQIDVFILPTSIRGLAAAIAKQCGIRSAAVADDLSAVLGNCAAAHPLAMLARSLETAAAGQRILVAGFGSGCDAIVFERTDAAASPGPLLGVDGWLARRKPELNYVKYLCLRGQLDIERGMRAEFDQKQPLTALWRSRKTVLGLVGGRCTQTGAVQFPRSQIGVSPNNHAIGTQEDYPLADRKARIVTYTADHLTYTPDPPACYGMIEFDGGGRMHAEFCDLEPEDVEVGREMRMMFRIKAVDAQRGFIRYFWKATPAVSS